MFSIAKREWNAILCHVLTTKSVHAALGLLIQQKQNMVNVKCTISYAKTNLK